MFKTILLVCLSATFIVEYSFAQNNYEDIQQQLLNDESDNSAFLQNTFEELEEYRDNPIDINSATKEQLEAFPFLGDKTIENILYYIYKYGPMLTVKELLLIEDIDRAVIEMLLPYICIKTSDNQAKTPTIENILKYGKQELSTRINIPLYKRKGYYLSDDENKHYLGHNYYNNIRYSYKYGNRINFGITAEKDYGEPFFNKGNSKGYDYYSIYIILRNIKRINSLAIGNYRVNYGYGMVINMDMNLGKTSSISTIDRKSGGIKKHSSTDEFNYLRGIALSYKLAKQINIDGFYSYRKMDATVDGVFIKSLKSDGYHRLIKEFEKKNSVTNNLIGTNLNYNGKYFECGLTAVYNIFNKVLNPELKYYNKFYPRGRDFLNIGVNYKHFYKKFTLTGETALDKRGAIAMINMLSYSPNYRKRFIVMNRMYDAKYQSLYANSVREGTSVKNENAIYTGMEYSLLDNLKFSGYADFFYFPYKRYLVKESGTKGYDFILQTVYSPINKLRLLIRYRHKEKDKNLTGSDNTIVPYIQRRMKLQVNYNINTVISSNSIVEGCVMNYKGEQSSNGFILSQSISFKFSTLPVELYLHGAYFNTDGYDARFTLYERDVLYAFSMPSFYYKGLRGAVYIKWSPFSNATIYCKYSTTYYNNRNTIGSALEEIDGNVKSDINIMLRLKF